MADAGGTQRTHVIDELRDAVSRGQFELLRDGLIVARMHYKHLKPNRYALLHTEVDQAHRGQGVGQVFVEAVLDEIRSRTGTVTVICPFVADYVSGAEKYRDLIDAKHPGHPDRAAAERGRATS